MFAGRPASWPACMLLTGACMSFATPSQLQARFDVRSIGDLLADDGTTVSQASQLTDANLQAALDDAAGEIVAACISNQHYTTANLTALAALDVSTYPSAALLIRLNCALAIPHLFGRRLYNQDEIEKRIPAIKWANETLEMLKNGQRVFELPTANVSAGVMQTAALGSNLASQGTSLVGHNARCFGITPVNVNDTQ